jgi:hypothetical protein
MCWHVDYFRARPSDSGRSAVVEEGRPLDVGEALLVFASFEKQDESDSARIVGKAAEEIAGIASQLKVRSIVLNPFAHLFGDLASPKAASGMLGELQAKLAAMGFEVNRLAFGIFYEIELKAKGHRLARISRIIS